MACRVLHRARKCSAALLALALFAGCGESEMPDDDLRSIKPPEIAPIVPASEALSGAHVPTLDPATMYEAEIRKALGSASRCEFRYTTRGKPVLAFTLHRNGEASGGVVKLNGNLIVLQSSLGAGASQRDELRFASDPVRMAVTAVAGGRATEDGDVRRREAIAVFELGQSLSVGYRGYLDCTSNPPVISPRRTSGR